MLIEAGEGRGGHLPLARLCPGLCVEGPAPECLAFLQHTLRESKDIAHAQAQPSHSFDLVME